MKVTFWHLLIGIGLIVSFFAVVGLIWYLLYAPNFTVTVPDFVKSFGRSATTTQASDAPEFVDQNSVILSVDQVLAGQSGIRFECESAKALQAEFFEERVRLALSDGRIVNLPQVVGEEGEVLYANADESFAFRNIGDVVFLEESGTVTYKNCTAAE